MYSPKGSVAKDFFNIIQNSFLFKSFMVSGTCVLIFLKSLRLNILWSDLYQKDINSSTTILIQYLQECCNRWKCSLQQCTQSEHRTIVESLGCMVYWKVRKRKMLNENGLCWNQKKRKAERICFHKDFSGVSLRAKLCWRFYIDWWPQQMNTENNKDLRSFFVFVYHLQLMLSCQNHQQVQVDAWQEFYRNITKVCSSG